MKRIPIQLPLLAIILAGMVIGIVTGLGRLGLEVPWVASERIGLHGPILIAGVFGTLTALERAVAMRTPLGRTRNFADALRALGAAGLIVLLVHGATTPAMLTAGAASCAGMPWHSS